MGKSLFEQMGGTYTQVGDYLIPNLRLPEQQGQLIGVWGQRHARYLKQYHKIIYMNLLTSGKLNDYLVDIENQAENLFLQLVKQLAESENITEELKAKDQMEWVTQMNNVYNRAREIVNSKLIFIQLNPLPDFNWQRILCYTKPKYFSKKSFSFSMTVCFFKALFEPPENLEIGGNILSRSVPVVFIPPSLKEFSINF